MAKTADSSTHLGRRSLDDSLDWLRVSALCGLCLDGVTTGYILTTDGYRELNPILADLWLVHPGVVAVYFLCFIYLVWAATRRWGWLSTTISAAVVVVMGWFGGLNNLVLIVFGPPSLLDLLADGVGLSAVTLVVTVAPICGLAVGLAAARVRHGRLPWRDVGVAVGGGGIGYLVYLRTARLLGGSSAVVL